MSQGTKLTTNYIILKTNLKILLEDIADSLDQ